MINDTTESIVSCTSKTTLICQFSRPLAMHRRILVVCPPFAEKEKGFEQWVGKVAHLSQELSVPVVCHCEKKSRIAIVSTLKKIQSGAAFSFESYKAFREWEELALQARHIREDDIIMFVSARQESVSYKPSFDLVPNQLEKHFAGISKIMIYPAQFESRDIADGYADIVVAKPFPFGATAIRRISREVAVFMKENQPQIRKKLRKKEKNTDQE
jgi:hypothetical protein